MSIGRRDGDVKLSLVLDYKWFEKYIFLIILDIDGPETYNAVERTPEMR